MNSGAPPDPDVLQKLQKTLADGLHKDKDNPQGAKAKAAEEQKPEIVDDRKKEVYRVPRSRSPEGSQGGGEDDSASTSTKPPPSKRARTSLSASTEAVSPTMSNRSPNGGQRTSLSMLADASLAAEIEGRTHITGLDANFKLSSVTEAIQDKSLLEDVGEGKTPSLLSKGIINAETAVELFRVLVS